MAVKGFDPICAERQRLEACLKAAIEKEAETEAVAIEAQRAIPVLFNKIFEQQRAEAVSHPENYGRVPILSDGSGDYCKVERRFYEEAQMAHLQAVFGLEWARKACENFRAEHPFQKE